MEKKMSGPKWDRLNDFDYNSTTLNKRRHLYSLKTKSSYPKNLVERSYWKFQAETMQSKTKCNIDVYKNIPKKKNGDRRLASFYPVMVQLNMVFAKQSCSFW